MNESAGGGRGTGESAGGSRGTSESAGEDCIEDFGGAGFDFVRARGRAHENIRPLVGGSVGGATVEGGVTWKSGLLIVS